jgi:hypothetical protein
LLKYPMFLLFWKNGEKFCLCFLFPCSAVPCRYEHCDWPIPCPRSPTKCPEH